MNKIVTRNKEETKKLGDKLWRKYKHFISKKPVVFALEGSLGSGKTQFVKGLAEAVGIRDLIISPTFVLETEYDKGKLIHIDTWRIDDKQDFIDLGWEKRLKENKVIVIEWAERVRQLLESINKRAVVIWVRLTYGKKENERIINWERL